MMGAELPAAHLSWGRPHSPKPSELVLAVLASLPALRRASFLDVHGDDTYGNSHELLMEAWAVFDDAADAIFDSPAPNLVDLAIVGRHFDDFDDPHENTSETARRFLMEMLLEQAGIDGDKCTSTPYYEAFGRSIGAPDWRDRPVGEHSRRQRVCETDAA